MAPPDDDLVEVRIVGLPIQVWLEAAEHHDGLNREFVLLAEGDTDHTPARLVKLGEELSARFSGFTTEPTSQLAQAAERGDATIDLVYRVPRDVGEASQRLGELLDEADKYCRDAKLLTLETPPRALAFRRWFLGEFIAQAEGAPAKPWPGDEILPEG